MTQRQAVKHLGTYLWKRERLGAVFTLLFVVYMGAIIGLSIDSALRDDEAPLVIDGMVDWIYLTMFPVFGLVMNRSAFGMWRDDYYSKRTAQWLTMPIPVAAIVKARFMQSAVLLPIMGLVFILLQYGIAPNLREEVSLLHWIENGIIWGFYAFIMNALYVLWELGYSGKQYCLFYLGYMILTAIIVVTLNLQDIHLFQELLHLTQEGYAIGIITGLAIAAAAAAWIGHRAAISRIRKRSMTF